MLGGVRRWLAAWLGSDEGSTGDESERTRFTPSPLDESVRDAHGGGNPGARREIADIQGTGERLEEERRET